MGFDFKHAAQEATKGNSSFLTEGRVKVETEDLLAAFPDYITVNGFDLLKSDNGKFSVVTFDEDNNLFYFGGSVLTSIVETWVDAYAGDCESGSKDLKASGGIKLKLKKEKSKQGRNYVAVEVI